MTIEIQPVPPGELDEDCAEAWERLTDDEDFLGVSATLITLDEPPYWSVGVAVAEFLREDPLETELRQQVASALRAVPGVEHVWEEDREVWGVTGTPSGAALVQAAAGVVDGLADQARAHVDSL